MALDDQTRRRLVFETFGLRRYVHDSPIRPDVWDRFLHIGAGSDTGRLNTRVSLILTPKETPGNDGKPAGGAGLLAECIRTRILGEKRNPERPQVTKTGKTKAVGPEAPLKPFRIAATGRNVVLDVTFTEMLEYVVPLTHWWSEVDPDYSNPTTLAGLLAKEAGTGATIRGALEQFKDTEFFRFVALVAVVELLGTAADPNTHDIQRLIAKLAPPPGTPPALLRDIESLWDHYRGIAAATVCKPQPPAGASARAAAVESEVKIWTIQLDRAAEPEAATLLPNTAGTTAGAPGASSPARSGAGVTAPDRASRHVARAGSPWLAADRPSSLTVKADAAITLFSISAADLAWAVVDTGIDARHRAFLLPGSGADAPTRTRVVATLDFTRLRSLLAEEFEVDDLVAQIPWNLVDGGAGLTEAGRRARLQATIASIRRRNVNGRDLDWALLELLIRFDPMDAPVPEDPHGTHVAGILAGDLPHGAPLVEGTSATPGEPFAGVCPDIRLYDLRVFGDPSRSCAAAGERPNASATGGPLALDATRGGDEFTILAALDYISWINRDQQRPAVHGVNLSLSLRHLVESHACGRTPVCDACNRLVANGTVVVAAAGNAGFDGRSSEGSMGTGYRSTSITDPGNAEDVITVGSTHRSEPHTYGVSYFSSRGPTGDGRMKPDLVAPGEKINSTIPGDKMLVKDGTSMAAPHVSGVCALLMARHRELIGQPRRIKQILMATSTDLGRERCFQGAGLVDALRALQSV
jgi:subtilisin family serine protease